MSDERKAGLLRRVFGLLWGVVNGLRRLVLNVIFLLIVGVFVAAFFAGREGLVVDGSVLVLRPTGQLVEQVAVADPLGILQRGRSPEQSPLSELVDTIEAARSDPRIKGLAIETDALSGAGLAKLQEIEAALEAFRASGKPVLAWGSRFTQGQYFLASLADEVYMAHDGFVLLQGFASYPTYYKGALDKLGVRMQVFRVGTYKAAVEPYTREGMSPEHRAASSEMLSGLWSQWRETVARRRALDDGQIDALVAEYPARLAAVAGDSARLAVDARLVDGLLSAAQWEALLKQRFGVDEDGKRARRTEHAGYLATIRDEQPVAEDAVAVVAVQGAIVDGDQPPGVAGAETIARLLREVREDESIKALVLRVDSPGGSVFASERIREEVELVRRAGKPVIASMSSVAASGGYWVSMAADEVWASASTLTGSIGIFGMFPDLSEPLARLGLTVDGVGTSAIAGGLDPRRPLSPELAAALQSNVDHGYRRFIEIVAAARKLSPEAVERVAEGRVWTGAQAHAHGLVDALGGLREAVAAAAKRAQLTAYTVHWMEAPLSARDEIIARLLRTSGLGAAPAAGSGPLERLAGAFREELRTFAHWNDPMNTYAHCLCAAP